MKKIFRFVNRLLLKLLEQCNKQVERYGAQISVFGIFSVINYIIPYFMWSTKPGDDYLYDIIIVFRTIAAIACFLLIIGNTVFSKFQKYLSFYWYATLLYCLPFLTTILFLYNEATPQWLINLSLSIFILATLVDWKSFLILFMIGTLGGYKVYDLITHENKIAEIFANQDTLFLTAYLVFYAVITGLLFSRHKDYIQKQVVAQLEHKVTERTHHLEEALQTKKEFLNNISHEIRTPIHGISAFSTALYENWHQLSDVKKYELSQKIYNNVDRLFEFVNNILDVAKFDSGKNILHIEAHNIAEVTQNIIDECEPLKFHKELEIHLNNHLSDPICYFDKVKIEQVIRNLIANAIKFTNKGKININLDEIKQTPKENSSPSFIQLAVVDEGIGIPKRETRTIFEPFTQSSITKTRAGGTGLGLSICKKIISFHKGRIWVKNNTTQGATFSFIIPRTHNS
ncbi:sensor histidine kinase [Rickettsiales endosymbiont of Stachyamoeba lipophora]|uniref:sensor histidine kinase n=1 Tax=Rickettsiales endosymbiont of Stachyamoeba lipophora TaxID=2486578 RepID=UPI000F65450D|nr:HAMP domain-containing sensor histidine kinase [Rickettsiales endosymbiont of Stachyamoeba lipophora]AZL16150.1 hypothetical protein EF513_06350 [Rickettsiales endosymbiont of Stachyamoeba lipophora]